jgi:hypothetical protein
MIANLHNADIPRPLLDVIARLRELGHAVYLVGGCVQDMVRKVHPARQEGRTWYQTGNKSSERSCTTQNAAGQKTPCSRGFGKQGEWACPGYVALPQFV